MNLDTLLYDKRADGVAVLTLNRVARHNAINGVMSRELPRVWGDIERDPDVRCVVVTGAGEASFCTGADLTDFVLDGAALGDAGATGAAALRFTSLQNGCWKPVITAVNGYCCGGGLHFVADSDLVLCSENATFFDTHVKVGLVAGMEPVGLARRIPLEAVLRMALLGGAERMDAGEALRLGLVGEVVARDRLLPRALDLAGKIARHSPTALARTKRAIWHSLEVGLTTALDHAWQLIEAHKDHPDMREGALAFAEKRAPRWARYGE